MRPRAQILAIAAAAGLAGATVALSASTSLTVVPLTSFATCTLQASAEDSEIKEDSPGQNYGAEKEIKVRADLAGKAKRVLVRFDLALCGLPAGAQVTSARLSMFLKKAPPLSRDWRLRPVTGVWTEAAVTWGTQPSVEPSATATTATGATDGVRIAWSVTADVQRFANGTLTNRGWRIEDTVEVANPHREGGLNSREETDASLRPRLDVAYYP